MKVTIHQPNYIPYIGYFAKAASADVFVSYDIAQYTKNGFINRNKIKTPHGWTWLTIPVKKPLTRPIYEIEIDNSKKWTKKHWLAIKSSYGRCKYFSEYEQIFNEAFEQEWTKLADINEYLLKSIFKIICPKVEFKKASELDISNNLDPTEMLIDITKKAHGEIYLSGIGGRKYLDEFKFTDPKLELIKFEHPIYKQKFNEFIPDLSIIDLLFNCGEESIKIMSASVK
jgi:hypothetical protein